VIDTIQTYLERYRDGGLVGQPCTETQVAELQKEFNLQLPAAYIAYLLIAGRQPPPNFVGSDCTIGYLSHLRAGANELLADEGQPPLPDQAFVFLMHQGYTFLYFIADGNSNDPPIFYYFEGEPGPYQKYSSFSDFLLSKPCDRQK
jgi:SMI1/KNR4 family protein SUKH-1